MPRSFSNDANHREKTEASDPPILHLAYSVRYLQKFALAFGFRRLTI